MSIGLLAGCGGSGSSSSNTKSPATISINASNSDSVAKGAVTSQSVANTGSSSASTVKAASLIADSTQQYSALSLALDHLKKAQSLPFPSSSGARAVAGWPLTLDCATGGTAAPGKTSNIVTYDIIDADSSGALSIGDTFSVNYAACTIGATAITMNGGTTLKFDAYHPSATSPATASDPDSGSITLGYSSFTIANSSTAVTIGFNGSMTMSYSYNGTLLSASMTGASFTASNNTVGSVTFTNFNLTSTVTSTTGTFSADMSISMTPAGSSTAGTINVSTPTTFSGPVGGNPTSGQMRIDGANGSYITITAGSSTVTIVVYDGTTTTTTTKPWDQI